MRLSFILPAFLTFAYSIQAQEGTQPLQCFVNPGGVPLVRANGIAEKVGDVLIICVGGDPVQSSTVNVQVFLNTDVTSRLLNTDLPHPATEALLLVDEPGSMFSPGPAVPCPAGQTLLNTCPQGSNVYQGVYPGASNTVEWLGVRFVPPGDGPPRIFRIVNLRAKVAQLPPGDMIPTFVYAMVSVTGTAAPPIASQSIPVAIVPAGVTWSLRTADNNSDLPSGGVNYQQCVANNSALALSAASSSAPEGTSFIVRVSENVGSALTKQSTYAALPVSTEIRPTWEPQNMVGFPYNTENGFVDLSYPAVDGMSSAGVASHATRFVVRFSSPKGGVQVHAPAWELGRGPSDSRVRLVAAEPAGAPVLSMPYLPLGPTSAALGTYYSQDMVYVYEVTAIGNTDPYMFDSIDLPFYVAHTGKPYVTLGPTTVSVNLAPIANAGPAALLDWTPRFTDLKDWRTAATLNACPAQPNLTASIGTKSGTANSRLWPITLSNSGTGTAFNPQIAGLTLTQTYGAACTPVVLVGPPFSFSTLTPGGSATTGAVIDFGSCSNIARFSAKISFSADGGVSGSSTFNNQYR